jgi:hypothetical protein
VAALAVLWVLGIIVYFALTNERQRENNLVIMWGLLLLAVVISPIIVLLGL